MTETPAGWFDDGQGLLRWWSGVAWTDSYYTAANGRPAQTPAPTSPGSGPAASVATPDAAPSTTTPHRTSHVGGGLGYVGSMAMVVVDILVATVTSAPPTESPYAHDHAADPQAGPAAATPQVAPAESDRPRHGS